jgi:hypothetical protein
MFNLLKTKDRINVFLAIADELKSWMPTVPLTPMFVLLYL